MSENMKSDTRPSWKDTLMMVTGVVIVVLLVVFVFDHLQTGLMGLRWTLCHLLKRRITGWGVVKIPVMKNPVPTRDAEGEKFIVLLALISFGMNARYAGDWGLSKEVFPVRKPNIPINAEERKPPGRLTLQDIFLKKYAHIPKSHSLPDLTLNVLLTDFPARVPDFKWCLSRPSYFKPFSPSPECKIYEIKSGTFGSWKRSGASGKIR